MIVMTTSNSTSVNAVRTPRFGHIASSPNFHALNRDNTVADHWRHNIYY